MLPFAAAILLSAFLLFWGELLFARMLLPRLGGAPSVWKSCLVFYQAVLLAGYAYAALIERRLALRAQVYLHILVLLAPLAFVPLGPPADFAAGAEPPGAVELLGLYTRWVGLPFFAVSTTAPLLQRWYSASGRAGAHDPYFLYAASNLGSVAALVIVPIVLDATVAISAQAAGWTAGYVLFAAAAAVSAFLAARAGASPNDPEAAAAVPAVPVSAQAVLRWALLALLPASLLHGVTALITQDLASVPLLWAVPLLLYLLTYVFAFSRPDVALPRWLAGAAPPAAVGLVVLSLAGAASRPWLAMAAHLAGFFAIALILHRRLAAERPAAGALTTFYLAMAGGGFIGGLIAAVLAPAFLRGLSEYGSTLVLALLLLGAGDDPRAPGRRARLLGLGVLSMMLVFGMNLRGFVEQAAAHAVWAGLAIAIGCAFRLPKAIAALGGALAILTGQFSLETRFAAIHTERSFFGISRVLEDRDRTQHSYLHGTTIHGRQSLVPGREREPLTYFTRTGPIGQALTAWTAEGRMGRAAVLGLGVGSLAAYARPGQRWTFFEIDPVVERIAREPRFFTYLARAEAPCDVVLGDGRLALAARGDQFDVIVLDAFSSDAVPIHLLTREAFATYLARLAEGGRIAVNITNRILDLEPMVAGAASASGLAGVTRWEREVSREEAALGKTPSRWVLLARSSGDLGAMAAAPGWRALAGGASLAWTDDFASVLSAIRVPGSE